MRFYKLCLFLLLIATTNSSAQFEFSGKVNSEYLNSRVFLIRVEDYSKSNLFLAKNILQETSVDSLGQFTFKGSFLPSKNRFYKIHIDKCIDSITNYKHLINECKSHQSILFIANGKDQIYFPLNDLEQIFCAIDFSRKENIAIQKIDSIQEKLLQDLLETRSDLQRKVIFSIYLKELQEYSKNLNEPLAELYAYSLYANRNSFGREFYLTDLKNSDYYLNLKNRLKDKYPNSSYYSIYQNDLENDLPKKTVSNKLNYLLSILLIISLSLNYYLTKRKNKKKVIIDYKKTLSIQEQKVFELIHQGLTNKEIAEKLFISLSTVKTHINTIYSKLDISSRKEVKSFFND